MPFEISTGPGANRTAVGPSVHLLPPGPIPDLSPLPGHRGFSAPIPSAWTVFPSGRLFTDPAAPAGVSSAPLSSQRSKITIVTRGGEWGCCRGGMPRQTRPKCVPRNPLRWQALTELDSRNVDHSTFRPEFVGRSVEHGTVSWHVRAFVTGAPESVSEGLEGWGGTGCQRRRWDAPTLNLVLNSGCSGGRGDPGERGGVRRGRGRGETTSCSEDPARAGKLALIAAGTGSPQESMGKAPQ